MGVADAKPGWLLFEDEHLLAVNKPAGWNTHAPSPYAGEGIYDWLRHREPAYSSLATIHRLDKETSGVLVFAKTTSACRSLTDQFAGRSVGKEYLLRTDRPLPRSPYRSTSRLVRVGERYVSTPAGNQGEWAETEFRLVERQAGCWLVEARPLTGRTHQIRVHAAEGGFPILGDALYGGGTASRLCLHARRLQLHHPIDGRRLTIECEPDFDARPGGNIRDVVIEPSKTNAFRLIHGAADGWEHWYVDRMGDMLLASSLSKVLPADVDRLANLANSVGARGVYHRRLVMRGGAVGLDSARPILVWGDPVAGVIPIGENGLRYEIRFDAGFSPGLFLDQRDNRRRLLFGHIAGGFPLEMNRAGGTPEVLNLFAYTCGFSICAARAGARVTSVDLSRTYLDWGRHHFELNGVDPSGHAFLSGDAMDWVRRFEKRGERYALVLLDPPTFARRRGGGVFRIEHDLGPLVAGVSRLVRPSGLLFVSANTARWPAEAFDHAVTEALRGERRKVVRRHYAPQSPDFPIHRAEPAHLKSLWMQLE